MGTIVDIQIRETLGRMSILFPVISPEVREIATFCERNGECRSKLVLYRFSKIRVCKILIRMSDKIFSSNDEWQLTRYLFNLNWRSKMMMKFPAFEN